MIALKLPDGFLYKLVNAEEFIVNSPEWKIFCDEFKKASKTNLVLKYSIPAPNSIKNLNATFICHHGFRASSEKYQIDNINDGIRKKKNGCPWEMRVMLLKRDPDNTIIKIKHRHNHDLTGHAETFLKISAETLGFINAKFSDGITPLEVHNILKKETMNRSSIPLKADIYRLFYKHRNEKFGAENGPKMWEKLKIELSQYSGKFYLNGIVLYYYLIIT